MLKVLEVKGIDRAVIFHVNVSECNCTCGNSQLLNGKQWQRPCCGLLSLKISEVVNRHLF
jgi:hypothetical protein